MKVKNAKMKKKSPEKIKYHKGTFSVVQFINFSGKLFECIPDVWFVNEEKTLCFWPPKSGKSFTLLAMNQEIPEEDWEVYECVIVSDGHATYSIGSAIVREKCSQYYNTSSAEEHLEAAQFRREHPGLINKGEKCFENVFSSAKASKTLKDHRALDKENLTATHSYSDSQSRINHSQSNSRSKSKEQEKSQVASNGIATHSYLDLQTRTNHSQSRSNRSKLSSSMGSRTHSRTASITHSLTGSRTHSHSGGRYHSRSNSKTNSRSHTKNHSSSSRTRSRSTSNIRSSPVLRSSSSKASYSNAASLSSSNRSRSRSDLSSRTNRHLRRRTKSSSRSERGQGLLTNRSYSSKRSGDRPEKRRYCHVELGNDRVRQCPQTNKSIRSRGVSSSAIRTGRNCYTRHPSKSTVRSRSRELSSPSTHTRRNCSIRQQTTAIGRSRQNDPYPPYRRFEHQVTPSTDELYRGIQVLINDVEQLRNIANKNDRRFVENDRRLTRMEVTVNKTFIMVGDLTQAINTRMSLVNFVERDNTPPRGFHMPRLPITRLKELAIINRDLENKKFNSFLINDQKHFCTPSKSTDNVVMTAYLKRFISLRIRALIVLKDLKGQSGQTLYEDFHRVYMFLIDVMKAGCLMHNKIPAKN